MGQSRLALYCAQVAGTKLPETVCQGSKSHVSHHQHLLLNKETNKRVRENQHCAAVECLYYATHYQFTVDVHAFGLVREPPRYIHISKVDKEWLVSQDPQLDLQETVEMPQEPTPEVS